MEFATNRRVALVVSGQTLERLKGGLVELVGPERDFGVISIRETPARIVEQLLDWRPAGVIMEFQEELTEQVAGLGLPTVVVMADMLMEGMGSVNVDDYAIGKLAGAYLWEKGLREFGFYGRELPHAPERRTGFLDELRRLSGGRETPGSGAAGLPASLGLRRTGLTRRVSILEIKEQGHRPAVLQKRLMDWLGGLPKPAGVFAAHDPLAREVLEACARLDLRVPEDVALISASNDPSTCELVYPGITSVEIPWEAVGLQAGRLIERMIQGEAPGDPVVIEPTGVRTRQSTDFYRVADERIQSAVAHMQAHLGAEIDINAVVRAVGVDRRALERLFRSQLNKSPKAVLTDMRTTRARELLEQSTLRIGEIAERCGFGTSEKLAAAFRKRFGKTPRAWRRECLRKA